MSGANDQENPIRAGSSEPKQIAEDSEIPVVPSGSRVGTRIVCCAPDLEFRDQVTPHAVAHELWAVQQAEMLLQRLFGLALVLPSRELLIPMSPFRSALNQIVLTERFGALNQIFCRPNDLKLGPLEYINSVKTLLPQAARQSEAKLVNLIRANAALSAE